MTKKNDQTGLSIRESAASFWQKHTLLFLVLLYILFRLVYLFFDHPLWLFRFSGEELYRGAMALEFLHGFKMPYWEYRADNYAGGSLVIAPFIAFFFKIFGPNVFSLKLTSVAIFAGALAVWFSMIARHLNKKTALYFALLFIGSPQVFTRYSLVPLGDHPETILLAGLSLYLFFGILNAKDGGKTREAALLGALIGFGIWFAYIFALVGISLFIFCLFQANRSKLARHLPVFVISFAMGFLPWILMNWKTGFSGFYIQNSPVLEFFSWEYLLENMRNPRLWPPLRLFFSFAHTLPDAAGIFVWSNRLYMLLFAVFILLGFIGNYKKVTAEKPVFFSLIYLSVFMFVSVWSSFTALRYQIPTQPFLFLLLAYFFYQSEEAWPQIKRFFRVVFSLMIMIGMLSSMQDMSLEHPGKIFSIKGYSYTWLGEAPVCSRTDENCFSYFRKFEEKLKPEDVRELSWTLAWKINENLAFSDLAREVQQILPHISPDFKRYFLYALGGETASRKETNLEEGLQTIETLKGFDDHDRMVIWAGMIVTWGEISLINPRDLLAMRDRLPAHFQNQFWRSVGEQWARSIYQDGPGSVERIVKRLPDAFSGIDPLFREEVLQGIGKLLYHKWRRGFSKPSLFAADLKSLSENDKAAVLEGMGIGMAAFRAAGAQALEDYFEELFVKDWGGAERDLILRGDRLFFEFLQSLGFNVEPANFNGSIHNGSIQLTLKE